MSTFEEIIKLKELLDSGAITKDEFELLKQKAMTKDISQGKTEMSELGISDADGHGKQVKVGDKLTYEIKYHNYYETATTVVITDIVPLGTTYVPGSASEGAQTIIESGKVVGLRWEINAKANAVDAVSFKVEVNENSEGGFIETEPCLMVGEDNVTIDKPKNIVVNTASKSVTPENEERSGIKAFGVWLGSAVIIQLIAGTVEMNTHPSSRIGNLLVALCMIAMMATAIVIAVKWKQGKLGSDLYVGEVYTGARCWWVIALRSAAILAVMFLIAAAI